MLETARLKLPYPEPNDPPDGAAQIKGLAERTDLVAVPGLVSVLPVNPYDGEEVYYLADAALGVMWHLRYRAGSASPNKWEYVGGPSLSGYSNVDVGSWGGGTWNRIDLPVLTAPLRGEYRVRYDCDFGATTVSSYIWQYGVQVNAGVAPIVGSEALCGGPSAASYSAGHSLSKLAQAPVALDAGDTVRMLGMNIGSAGRSTRRSLELLPVRVS